MKQTLIFAKVTYEQIRSFRGDPDLQFMHALKAQGIRFKQQNSNLGMPEIADFFIMQDCRADRCKAVCQSNTEIKDEQLPGIYLLLGKRVGVVDSLDDAVGVPVQLSPPGGQWEIPRCTVAQLIGVLKTLPAEANIEVYSAEPGGTTSAVQVEFVGKDVIIAGIPF